MSKRTLYLLGILATIIIGTLLYNKYCCCDDCFTQQTEKNIPPMTDNFGIGSYNIFKLSGNDFNYSCHDNFKFSSNSFNTIKPINDSINEGINQLKAFFDKNPKEKLIITGYALNSEKNTSAFPNLGLARANDVKNYFVSKGFIADKFETQGELKDAWKVSNNTILGAIDFKIKEEKEIANTKAEDWNALKAKINANPLVLYFKSSKAEIKLTENERQKIADLSKYIDNVPEAKISCMGHTDGTGNRDTNLKLGQNRADFAKNYLSKNGINSNRIESFSKGPDEPIADNTSPAGKAKNRRTVVTIK
jgi:OmpA-OmpF porin, OOP family